MKVRDFFNNHLIFRFSEFKHFMEEREQGFTPKNCYMTLYNYCKKRKLSHVRKELYVVNSENRYQSMTIPPLLIAGKASEDAILAYHSALESHGLAYTDFNEQTYLSGQRSNSFYFQNQHYRAIYRPSLIHHDKQPLGIENHVLLGHEIKRTNLERTLVDVLDRPEISGGWEEVIRSLDRITVFDVSLAVEYALSLNHASIVAKLGYYLEHQRSEYFQIDSAIIERLIHKIPKRPYYIDRKSSMGSGSYIKKWQIIVPDYLHKRQWEEPENDIDQ